VNSFLDELMNATVIIQEPMNSLLAKRKSPDKNR
jgi:hypothetical protein